jgi:putative transposase
MARVVVPGYPHHVTQRGSRGAQTFFGEADYRFYLSLVAELCGKAGVEVWAYCLMPNHVHFAVVPEQVDSLARLFRVTHHRYARRVNARNGWQGHLWQARFFSCVMDEQHLLAAVRYIELNPVRAGLCDRPEQWPWSSVQAHQSGRSDGIVNASAMHEFVSDWSAYLALPESADEIDFLRQQTRTGRPAAAAASMQRFEQLTGRRLRRRKSGPRPRN